MSDILERLSDVIESRREADPQSSDVARLLRGPLDSVLKKVGEEATETVIAGKGGSTDEVIYETADLWFHSLVLLRYLNIEPQQVLAELERRFGQSGIVEKASRS